MPSYEEFLQDFINGDQRAGQVLQKASDIFGNLFPGVPSPTVTSPSGQTVSLSGLLGTLDTGGGTGGGFGADFAAVFGDQAGLAESIFNIGGDPFDLLDGGGGGGGTGGSSSIGVDPAAAFNINANLTRDQAVAQILQAMLQLDQERSTTINTLSQNLVSDYADLIMGGAIPEGATTFPGFEDGGFMEQMLLRAGVDPAANANFQLGKNLKPTNVPFAELSNMINNFPKTEDNIDKFQPLADQLIGQIQQLANVTTSSSFSGGGGSGFAGGIGPTGSTGGGTPAGLPGGPVIGSPPPSTPPVSPQDDPRSEPNNIWSGPNSNIASIAKTLNLHYSKVQRGWLAWFKQEGVTSKPPTAAWIKNWLERDANTK